MPAVASGSAIYANMRRQASDTCLDNFTRLISLPVSPEYFCNLGANLMRLDHEQRPELNKGTVDFAVNEEYWASQPLETLSKPYVAVEPSPTGPRQPAPMDYIFALDISFDSIQSGFARSACSSIRKILYGGLDDAVFPLHSKVAFITYDRALHFYDLSVSSQSSHERVSDTIDLSLGCRWPSSHVGCFRY